MSIPIPLQPRHLQLTGGLSDVGKRSIVVSPRVVGIPQWMQVAEAYRTKRLAQAAERGIKKAVEYLLEETLVVTPKSKTGSWHNGILQPPGNLRRSGHTTTLGNGFNTKGIVFFDADQAPYAIFVHEDLTKKHDPPTYAKFLSRTQWRLRGKMNQIVGEEMAKVRPTL